MINGNIFLFCEWCFTIVEVEGMWPAFTSIWCSCYTLLLFFPCYLPTNCVKLSSQAAADCVTLPDHPVTNCVTLSDRPVCSCDNRAKRPWFWRSCSSPAGLISKYGVRWHCGNMYLTSLPLVSVRHRGYQLGESRYRILISSTSSVFLVCILCFGKCIELNY